ncbi:hypothetical protein AJ79_10071 [Helicocarpus griseus UAMH5409]|uniref:Aminoglycoside phosphotransferase domain-containing protein n=1 Tax=Helicocarpus griseus UAMH5409 TaxID=1447875 RepID=A0A2B7WFV7_9EURO|nr:hypothetical protein AJ79_10071 [Helicocarpus griseus UAMH5409]
MSSATSVQQALSLIESANLEHTEHKLLTLFIEDAVDPAFAAKYILDRENARTTSSKEYTLRLIKNDWRRLLSKLEDSPRPSYITKSLGGMSPLLEAFITPSQYSRMREILQCDESIPSSQMDPGHNHLLNILFMASDYIVVPVGPGARLHLSDERGDRIRSSVLQISLATDDLEKRPPPSPLLLSIHSRLSTSLRWAHIEDQHRGDSFLIMTGIAGQPVQQVFHLMTYKERERLVSDLQHCILQFRQVPNKNGYLICNALGGPVFDYRIDNDICGPFESEEDFNDSLVKRDDVKPLVKAAHSKKHHIYFTHGDLGPANILVEGGKLAGIVDFECSGFMPEYWEYTKAMFDLWGTQKPWVAMINSLFGEHEYKEELKAEKKLWEYRNPW